MARHLEFDRTEVIARAVDAFWRFGYDPLSAMEIAEAMGVAKSSLYNTFGSKRDLFLESVDHYANSQRSKLVARAGSENAGGLLREILLEVVSGNNAGRGCLLVNTAAEFGARDGEVCQHVKAGFNGMMDAFANLIRAGQEAGQFKSGVNPHQYAVILVTAISGLRVLAKGGCSADELNPVIENILAGLME
ncbi:TetR/AcrR family transcriptional regulator [Ralstonia sp. SET104]|uniref:TetR/AcrR family transcriptional regulator n=1 Tax=Ralstonia sp. SET104 TaxID=2448774 RepID=UPI000F562AE9|nr:TetR/AcrR family transcriptional regulator [Ralstonia sp. SET104]